MTSASPDAPRYRHEAIGVVLRVDVDREPAALTALAARRRRAPHEGRWALPSGALAVHETIEASLTRHLARTADAAMLAHLEQLETRSDPTRDPAQRTVGTACLGLVSCSASVTLAADAAWLPVDALPSMAFDHAEIVATAVERLRGKLSYTNLAFALAPETFTMAELRVVYEAALGHDVAATNLQRVLQRRGQLEPTGETAPTTAAGGRPARRYRFTNHTAQVTDPFAMLRPTR